MFERIAQMEPWYDEHEAKEVYKYMTSGGWLTEHTKTSIFEQKIAQFTNSKHCIVTTNGTVTLTLALLALGLKPNDQILVPNLTMIATANAGKLIGIEPIFVDIEQTTLCMDLAAAQKSLTSKTKALVYVSLNGRSGPMHEVVRFCKDNKLFLIEDAAQSLGSSYKGKHLGTFGDIGSFSFSVPKIITTGQGGALVTQKLSLYKRLRLLKDFGRKRGGIDIHDEMGWNFKFTDLQAVIGIEQMKKLAWRVQRKKQLYQRYTDNLCRERNIAFVPTDLQNTCPWFVDIYVAKPEKLQKYLKNQGVESRLIYPPLTSQKIYYIKDAKKRYPISYHFGTSGLWLPSSSKLTNKQVDTVCTNIKEFFK